MKRVLRFVLSCLFLGLGACEHQADPFESPQKACVEFDYATSRDGHSCTCRVVWCERMNHDSGITGGPSVLWCERDGEVFVVPNDPRNPGVLPGTKPRAGVRQ